MDIAGSDYYRLLTGGTRRINVMNAAILANIVCGHC
jgi:hypothetical protein